ncbi:MhpC Predicted hydrolases or acyltransferases (alpha/beta hydrolase superfamily) [Candidatus Nanopelagicaceae bacterium]
MQTFSTTPFRHLFSRTGKIAALATAIALIALSVTAYTQSQPDYPKTLSGYYTQEIDWKSCRQDFQCGTLAVPIDYKKLSTGTFEIALLKYEARTSKKLGSLIVNPGGPGGSGVDYAYAAEYIFSPAILDRYDIVGFDPRGVSRSAPIRCLTDKELDANNNSDSKPDNEAEFQQILQDTKKYVEKCKDENKYLTSYSTASVARDLDILREAVGDKQLNYMGKSYGTYLGTLYAHFFPEKVGRVVLDGAVDPSISNFQQTLTQAIGFDQAFNSFAADCNKRKNCTLPKDQEAAVAEMRKLLSQAAKKPFPAKNQSGRTLSESMMVLGTASAMYDSQTGWPQLRKAIAEAQKGYGDRFLKLADEYTGRQNNGSYPNNEFDSGAVIDCLDFNEPRSVGQIRTDAKIYATKAPLFGPYLAYGGVTCKFFNQDSEVTIEPTTTANPVIVIGTTGDPATPYEWSQGLSKLLTNSRLISLTGEGHTGQGQGNACIDNQIDDFYLTGKAPTTSTCN